MKNRKWAAAMAAMLLAAASLSGCAGNSSTAGTTAAATAASPTAAEQTATSAAEPSASAAQSEGATRTIVDMQGNSVEIPAGTQTIASGKGNLTQITLIVGGPSAVATLGQGADCSEGTLMHAMFPSLHGLETFGENDMNLESLLNIDPDLVLIYGTTPSNDLSVQLQDSGFTVALCNLKDDGELLQTMQLVSDALGGDTGKKVQAYQEFYQGIMKDVADRSASIAEEKKPKVAYMRGNGAVCGPNSMPQKWITAAGGINIGELAGIEAYAAEMTSEELLNYNPDIIFCESKQTLEFLSGDEYRSLKAVEDGALYVVPYGLSCSGLANAENPLVWQWAANYIQPEVYQYDADQTVRDFFSTFYGYELTEEQLEKVLYPAGRETAN